MEYPHSNRRFSIHRGKTFIEVIISLSIVALLSSMALPSFHSTISNNRADAYINNLARTVQGARSWAVSSKSIISLCPYTNTGCGDDWQQGLMLFTDPNNNGILDEKERLLELLAPPPGNYFLQWRASGGKHYLRFSPTGMARQFGKFHLCNKSGEMRYARTLLLNRQGRLKHYRDTDHDGVVDDGKGNSPEC